MFEPPPPSPFAGSPAAPVPAGSPPRVWEGQLLPTLYSTVLPGECITLCFEVLSACCVTRDARLCHSDDMPPVPPRREVGRLSV